MAGSDIAEKLLFDIPRQRADLALVQFAEQADLTLIVPFDRIQGETLNPLAGQYSIEEAIKILLQGTRLDGVVGEDGQLSIVINQYSEGEGKEMPIIKKSFLNGIAAFFASVLAVSPASAQDRQNFRGVAALEEIVVTAQKRNQNLEDVPISISVVSGDKISKQNLISLFDLSESIPSLQLIPNASTDTISLRGVSSGTNVAFEQSVVTFVDGVYHGRARQSRSMFMDIAQVEILKGPQSTYFGNNAIAGALNITTRKPGDKFEGHISALYEPDHEEYNVEAAFGGPITDTLGARVAIRRWGMEGYLTNDATGNSGPQGNNLAGRTTLAWTPNDEFDATFKIELGRVEQDDGFPLQIDECPSKNPLFSVPTGVCAAALANGDDVELDNIISGDPGQFIKLHTREYVLTLNYEKWGHTFTSITGYSSHDSTANVDADGSGAIRTATGETSESWDQFSQELRIASPTGGRLEYLGGLYYQEGSLDMEDGRGFPFLSPIISSIQDFAPLVPYLPLGRVGALDQEEESFAVFGALTWNITDALSLTAGLRYTEVDKVFDRYLFFGTLNDNFGGNVTPFPAAVAPVGDAFARVILRDVAGSVPTLKRSDDDVIPSITVQYDLNDDVMVYASYVEGFKAGGFDGQDTRGDPSLMLFDPETVEAYEIGMKSKWLDGRIFLNVGLFRNEYADLQQSVSTREESGFAVFQVDNVGGLISQGVEIETGWAISDRLSVGLSMSLLDSEYEDYLGSPCTTPQRVSFVAPPPPASQTCTQDLTGKTPLLAPEISGNFNVEYVYPLSGTLELVSELDVFFTSDYNLRQDLDPLHVQDDYAKLDGRITLRSTDGRWDLAVIGKNLTDEEIITFSTNMFTSNGSAIRTIGRERNIAIQASYHW